MEENRLSNFRTVLVTLVTFIISVIVCPAQSRGPVLWNLNNYQSKSSPKKVQTIKRANAALKKQPYTIVHKKSFSGNVHNYESLAYYAWPNGDGTYTVKDGHPSPDYTKYDAKKIYGLGDILHDLGLAFYTTSMQEYASAAVRQLRVWFIDDSTKMNPNFNYGQLIPGHNNNNGHPGVISEAYSLLDVLDCISLLESDHQLDRSERHQLKTWFKSLNKWLCNSEIGHKMDQHKNNLSIMYDVLRYRIAMFTNDKDLKRSIRDNFLEKRIIPQFAQDGTQPEELKRNKSMMYSIFNLSHALQFCRLLQYDGYDCSVYKSRLTASVDFIRNYINNKEAYPYQEIGQWDKYVSQFNEACNLYREVFLETVISSE